MFRRTLILGLVAVGVLAPVADVRAFHHHHRYNVGGCGYYCHGKGSGYKVAKVYRTYKVPVKVCTTTCVTVTDPCNPCCTKTVPTQTCTTVYTTKRVLIHTQRVPAGPVYGRFTDGSHRVVWGGNGYSGYGAAYGRAPYRAGTAYGSGGYRMGGYGASKVTNDFVTGYKQNEKISDSNVVGVAF